MRNKNLQPISSETAIRWTILSGIVIAMIGLGQSGENINSFDPRLTPTSPPQFLQLDPDNPFQGRVVSGKVDPASVRKMRKDADNPLDGSFIPGRVNPADALSATPTP